VDAVGARRDLIHSGLKTRWTRITERCWRAFTAEWRPQRDSTKRIFCWRSRGIRALPERGVQYSLSCIGALLADTYVGREATSPCRAVRIGPPMINELSKGARTIRFLHALKEPAAHARSLYQNL
jgi:hypothetical protein